MLNLGLRPRGGHRAGLQACAIAQGAASGRLGAPRIPLLRNVTLPQATRRDTAPTAPNYRVYTVHTKI